MRNTVIVALVALAAAGCSSDQPTQAPPSSSAAAPAPASPGKARDLAGVDPCSLLTTADLAPILKDTAPDPKRDKADGQLGCAWGDGEFRGVWLTFAAPAKDGKRAVPIGSRQGSVVEEMEYTCDVRVDIDGTGIELRAVSSDKTEWCQEAATALTAAVGRLGW